MDDKTFAYRFRTALNARGKKQVDVSKETGIHKAIISSYLKGLYEPKLTNLGAIAKALDVEESYLLGFDVPMNKSRTRLLEDITNTIQSLEEDDLIKVKAFVDLFATKKKKGSAEGSGTEVVGNRD